MIKPEAKMVGWKINKKILEAFKRAVDNHEDDFDRRMTYTEACEGAMLDYIDYLDSINASDESAS